MKKEKLLLIILCLYAFTTVGLAQNYQIDFTGSGLSNTVDSVQVLNLARGTSVTVKSTEGLQLVATTTDIENHLSGKGSLGIFPNPMTETSGIEFFNLRGSPVSIEVFDMTGKLVILDKQHLIQGNHKFEISGLNPGIYMVNVLTFNGRYVGKLLSNVENSGTPTIRYQGNNNLSAQKSVLKSTQNLAQMQYNEGERLLLKGISGNYSRVLTMVPTQNQTINFLFVACTDAGGNHYPVVTIGNQTWMAENLAYLPSVSPSSQGSQTTPFYYVYGYQGNNVTEGKATSNYQTYGVLYNWPAAMNACPSGWHLPTDAEWTELQNYLMANGYNFDGTTTGNKSAKSLAASTGWFSSSNIGSVANTDYPEKRNITGFSALPGGFRNEDNNFYNIGFNGYWWSAAEFSSSSTWYRGITHNFSYVYRNHYNKKLGFSVRCLRD